MSSKNFTRRSFIGKTSAGIAGAAITGSLAPGLVSCTRTGSGHGTGNDRLSGSAFATEVERLPVEEIYDYHKRLSSEPVHIFRRDKNSVKGDNEMAIADVGWKITWIKGSSMITDNAVDDFMDYLKVSHNVTVDAGPETSLERWQDLRNTIVVGTRDQLTGCSPELKASKDYELRITPDMIVVCGYDDLGAMHGLYNLESRMNLREAPCLPSELNCVRHALYDRRIVLSWMGWMEFQDPLLCHLAHDGFDGIFASVYANPNGDRTTAENSTDFYARLMFRVRQQDPKRMRDLIDRASKYGIKVYAPILWQFLGTKEDEDKLRNLVRDIVKEFPDIKGYILLTEGFWYEKWGGGHGADKEYMQNWARNWARAVEVVAEECHKADPAIEILPWEYNIDFRASNVEMKCYFIQQLSDKTIPLLTWENGKSFKIDGMEGSLRDYSINQVGPAEVTEAQIGECRKRGMKVYTNSDTFLCGGQFQTISYNPFPYQWHERYMALEKFGVNGTLESWSAGYTPNFMTEFRNWYCWSGYPDIDELLGAISDRNFGKGNRDKVLKAWDYFSQAVRFVPDTGPTWGTNNSVGSPIFFKEPPARTATFMYSWTDFSKWMSYFGSNLNPRWPFTVSRLVFYPDFTNNRNRAEDYARSSSGIAGSVEGPVLPVYLKYLKKAADLMEEGMKLYREAALASPENKRAVAVREVLIAEQLQRMMESEHALLEFEDLRMNYVAEGDKSRMNELLDKMEAILREEIDRTELSLLASSRDSRLGFQFECDYVFTPYSLSEKLEVLRETLEKHLPEAREKGRKNNG
ncbi:MAG: hypothetical protein GX158_08445 [Bacteroidales bacterium]|nr:hypothetical protein [Bacteroidales bacterium]